MRLAGATVNLPEPVKKWGLWVLALILAVVVAFWFYLRDAEAEVAFEVRSNDSGYLEAVRVEDVAVTASAEFELANGITTENGFSWGGRLAGMTTSCRTPTSHPNPCQWPGMPLCQQTNGTKPTAKAEGTPTLPFTAIDTETGGTVLNYQSGFPRAVKPFFSFSRFGCDALGQSDWGDSSWAVVLPEPSEAVCFRIRFVDGTLRRQHFNFWRDNGGAVEMIGHFDAVGEPVPESGLHEIDACFVSNDPSVLIDAVSTWQDGAGTWVDNVSIGVAATTACDRAQRAADEAQDEADAICLQ